MADTPKKRPPASDDSSKNKEFPPLSESKSGNVQHPHVLPSSKYKSKRPKNKLSFLGKKKENQQFLSYEVSEEMQEVRDAKHQIYLLHNAIAKQVFDQGIDMNRLSPDEVKKIASAMGVKNMQVNEQLIKDLQQRVIRMQNSVNYSQTPKRKL
jgi:hypothetical protein